MMILCLSSLKPLLWMLLSSMALTRTIKVNAFQTPPAKIPKHVLIPTPTTSSSTSTLSSSSSTTQLALTKHEKELTIPQNHSRRHYLQNIIGTASASSLSLLLTTTTTATATTIFTHNPPPAFAAQTTGEAIRRSAANLPGYGQADVFYPSSFLGKWKMTHTIVSSDDPMIVKSFNGVEELPLILSYDVRFITVDGDDSISVTSESGGGAGGGIIVEKVIADRQYNENSYYNALRNVILKKQTQTNNNISLPPQPPSIQTTTWSPSNPNVLTCNYNDGSNKEIKVTKRATELDEVNGIISSSEYRRITTTGASTGGGAGGGAGGIPSIAASRMLKKWKMSEYNGNGDVVVVEGIEIIYSDGGTVGDPLMASPGGVGGRPQQPQLSSKSRLRLERL